MSLNLILSGILPTKKETLDNRSVQYYTDGYRTSVPTSNLCRENSDCDPGELCQGGYCAGVHRRFGLQGVYRHSESATVAEYVRNALRKHQQGHLQDRYDHDYDYS